MIAFVNNRHNPLPKINRQRLGHARRALSPARRVNHIASGLGILNEIVSFDDALVFDDEDDQCSLNVNHACRLRVFGHRNTKLRDFWAEAMLDNAVEREGDVKRW